MSIYSYSDYRLYLSEAIASLPRGGHGARSALARKVGCQSAYLSRVLAGNAQLSLEQAYLVSEFFHHGEEERKFFLLLVEHGRAGSDKLRRFFKAEMERARQASLQIKNRIAVRDELSFEDRAEYYGSWYYAAIHALISIPEFRTPAKVAEYFSLPLGRVQGVLAFLASRGLAIENKGSFSALSRRMHLPSGSPLVAKHHGNWRLRAMAALDSEADGGLHYSSLITCSEADSEKVREILLRAIEEARAVVKASADEKLFCYNLDLFEVG